MNPAILQFKTTTDNLLPPDYFDPARNVIWTQDSVKKWIPLREPQYRKKLTGMGICDKKVLATGLSDVDVMVLAIQLKQNIDFATVLAGYRAGLHDISGKAVLVTEDPKIITPAEGPFPLLWTILRRLFPVENGVDQLWYFLGWLKNTVECCAKSLIRPAHGLVMCGPPGGGKGVVQNHIVTPLCGGRVAKPFQFISGATAFNSDSIAAVHQMIEDEQAVTDPKTRAAVGTMIKNMIANEVQRIHPKGREAIMLRLLWRVTVSLNDDPVSLSVLPSLDDAIADKLIILHTADAGIPALASQLNSREDFEAALHAELPALIHHLLNWEIPEEIKGHRFGLKAYQNPYILGELRAMSPEEKFMSLIEQFYKGNSSSRLLDISAAEIENDLTSDDSSTRRQASQLLSWSGACGQYLGKLANQYPERVTRSRTADRRAWTITPWWQPPPPLFGQRWQANPGKGA